MSVERPEWMRLLDEARGDRGEEGDHMELTDDVYEPPLTPEERNQRLRDFVNRRKGDGALQ